MISNLFCSFLRSSSFGSSNSSRSFFNELSSDEINIFLNDLKFNGLVFVPEKDISPLNMSVEEAFKMLVSGGIVAPQELYSRKQVMDNKPDENKEDLHASC